MLSSLFSKEKAAEESAAASTSPVQTPAPEKAAGQSRRRPRSEKGKSRARTKREAPPVAWSLADFPVPAQADHTRFHDLGLPDELMHAIQDLGFQYCSPIQAQILPHTLRGLDAIGKAQTGTGKTAAFLITLLDDFFKHPLQEERFLGEPRALIVAPTRELVAQIASDAEKLSKYLGFNVVTLIGGVDYHKQKQRLMQDYVDVVVATPGRLIDFMTRKDIYLDRVESLVLDEADRMLDMGFIPQVKRIVRALPDVEFRQTQLYSATFSPDILNLARRWTHDPVKVEIEPENVATDSVEQRIYMVAAQDKLKVVFNLLRQPEVEKAIVFVNRRDQAQRLYDRIIGAGIKAGLLSGEIQQHKRTRTLEAFKKDQLQILVATDVVGRGIHVEGITHVINFNLPEDPEDYVHRIGRTGRAGALGISISLACEDEAFQLPAIEALLGEKLNYELAPQDLLE